MHDSDNQAERVFASVVGLDPRERAGYLDKVCRDSPTLRVRVEELLAEDERAGSFLEQPLMPELHAALQAHSGDGASAGRPSAGANGGHGDEGGAHQPQFQPEDVLLGRFVVVRYIARGGMGEVYEVEDLQLRGARVALKTILSHFAADPLMHERFKREVLAARSISHPNVCPIYDLFQWDRPEGRLLFLTMKLLPGETLSSRLERTGPLPLAETTAIARQVGAGLAAAHAAGMLHRDIKAANILLSGVGDKVYACLTDFGLARAIVQENTALTVHGVPGTPGYVAPELFYGEPPSMASDVFAFGVVVYQMLTGKLPRGAITDAQSRKDLQDAAPAPWRRMVESCLQPKPATRCQDIDAALRMVAGLAGESSGRLAVREASGPHRVISRRRVLAMAGATAAASGVGAWVQFDRILNFFHPLPAKRYVALMAWPVNDSSALVATVLDAVSARLIHAESAIGNFVVFSSQDLLYGPTPVRTPNDAATVLGATLVLTAALSKVNGGYDLELALVDVATSGKLRHKVVTFASEQVASIETKASEIAARMLGVPESARPMQDLDELHRLSPEELQIFSEARRSAELPNDSGLENAVLQYQKVVELEPHFALGYAELAVTYIRRFLSSRDRANVSLAQANSTLALRYNPNSAKALLSAALVRLYSDGPKAALDAFGKALGADPGNAQVLVYQAQAYRSLNKYDEAAEVYRQINSERPNYWVAYNELGYLLSQQGKHVEAADAFRKAIVAAPPVAIPEANLGSEYLYLNQVQQAVEACQRSIDKKPNEAAYRTLGDIAFTKGDYRLARTEYVNASHLNSNSHETWRDIGDCDAMLGNASGVRESYAQAARALQAVMSKGTVSAYAWSTLAFYLAKTGDRTGAGSALRKVAPYESRNVGTQLPIIEALAILGKREEAMNLLLLALDHGLTTIQVDFSLDLKDLSRDPRYLSRVAKLKGNAQSGT